MRFKASLKRMLPKVVPGWALSGLKKKYYAARIQEFWEKDIVPLKYLISFGDSVIDIGAHVGWYTRILADLVGTAGKVYSIEPIPETAEILMDVIKRLRMENVHANNCAVSDSDGFVVMEVPVDRHGVENFYRARITSDYPCNNGLRQYRVVQRTIDALFAGSEKKISFIKCDVEGHEYSVVKGASQLIAEDKPAWLIEVSGDPDDTSSESERLFRYLRERDYTPYLFDGAKLRRRRKGDTEVNYHFLQRQHVEQLHSHGMIELQDDAKRL